MFPLRHRLRIIARQQASAHEHAQQPPAHLRLHLGDGVGIDPGGGMEDDPARGSGVEHAVDDDTVKVEVGIEAGAETVDEGHRTEVRRGACTGAVRLQVLLHHAQEQAQGSTLEIGVAVQEVAQPLGHRQDPLAHRQRRQDVIGEMRRGRHHAPGIARWTHAPALAREGDQEVVPTLPAPGPGKAVCEDSAFQVMAELPLHTFRHRPLVIVIVAALGEPGLEVLLDAAIEHALARTARPIPRRCAVGGPALGPHARPLCAALRRWGSGWAACYACRHWPQRLGRAAEGSWLNSRRRLRIAGRRSPRQWRLTGPFRGGCERRELAGHRQLPC